jgi:hypothetical protein
MAYDEDLADRVRDADPPGLHDDALQRWVDQAAAFVRDLQPKTAK